MIKKFSDTQPPAPEQETDRLELKEGLLFVIDGIAIVPSAKYEFIGKVNGYDLVTKQRLKYRTTSKVLIEQLRNMIKADKNHDGTNMYDHIKVLVSRKKSEKTGRFFLTFEDPGA